MASTASTAEEINRKHSVQRPTKAAAPPHRYTLRVPLVDTSIEAWWAAQDDPSASVRALIREEIMKNGFSDTVNRPVAQLPRRGRPPGSGLESVDGAVTGYDDRDGMPEAPDVRPAGIAWERIDEPGEAHQVRTREHGVPEGPDTPGGEPAGAPEPIEAAVSGASSQVEMEDIFGH